MGGCFACCGRLPVVDGPGAEGPASEPAPEYATFADFFAASADRRMGSYVFERLIGQGFKSHVYRALDERDSALVAIKVYAKSHLLRRTLGVTEILLDAVRREIELMYVLKHAYIVSLVEWFVEPRTESLMFVMPFAEYGTLETLLNSNGIAPCDLQICFLEIAQAFRYLHSVHVVHRDLKPDNILCFRKDHYALSDFNSSMQLESPNQKLEDTKGSPAFLSPEECSGNPYFPKPADVWAFGVTLYRSVFQLLPFKIEALEKRDLSVLILAVDALLKTEKLEFPEGADERVVELLEAVLKKDPTQRPTFEQIVNYAWFDDARETDEALQADAEEFFKAEEQTEN
jgi:serine/threonine protein kinase